MPSSTDHPARSRFPQQNQCNARLESHGGRLSVFPVAIRTAQYFKSCYLAAITSVIRPESNHWACRSRQATLAPAGLLIGFGFFDPREPFLSTD